MKDKFFELKKEKQDRMINAALQVFARYGYNHASTDEIVKVAGISKGLLFHYFESKIGLYAFLYDYATRFVTLELARNVDKNENDYFGLYKQILESKADAMAQYPYIYLFLNKADDEESPEALREIVERREKYNRIKDALRERADITVFPSNISYSMTWDMLEYTINGLFDKSIKADNFRADLFLEEAIEYVDLVKQMVLS